MCSVGIGRLELTSTLATRSIADILSDSQILSSVLLRHIPRRGADQNSNNTNPSLFNHHHTFISADANTTLKQACKLLHQHSLDFLPVLIPDDMRVLATITYTTILEHLVTHFENSVDSLMIQSMTLESVLIMKMLLHAI